MVIKGKGEGKYFLTLEKVGGIMAQWKLIYKIYILLKIYPALNFAMLKWFLGNGRSVFIQKSDDVS